MTVRFEVNPPKIIQNSALSDKLEENLEKLKQRVFELSLNCDSIHITDSVLGVSRVSPITVGSQIKNEIKKMNITTSLRVRDRNLISLTQKICDSVLLDLDGVLILKGDPPPTGPKDSKLVPSEVVKNLKELGFDKKIDLYLSLSNNPDFGKLSKKIDAEPTGFVTQVIHSEDQVQRIVDELKPQGFKIIPCILLPSEKNSKSADFLKLDWSNYKERVIDFVKSIHKMTGDVLITSPSDFTTARQTISELVKFV